MSVFDAGSFLQTTTTTANSTDYVPIPEGDFMAVIKDVKARQAKESTILDVIWSIDDAAVKEATGIDEPSIRQSVFLDITAQGALDNGKGKNVQLGRLRDAVNQNGDGQPWSPTMLLGQVARINVKHRLDGELIRTDVKGVVKA